MGQMENESRGPYDCPACKGNGYVTVIEKVDHFEKIVINNIKKKRLK